MLKKYHEELGWWLRETADVIMPWYRGQRKGVWGHELPADPVCCYASEWENSIATLARIQTQYYTGHLYMDPTVNRGKMLDIGCGPMLPARHMAYDELWCLDPLMEHYATAGFPVKEVGAVLLPMHAENMWAIPSDFFDTIISVNALDHVDNFLDVAREIERVAKPTALLRFEVTYHAPTPTEPISLDDIILRESFKRFQLKKVTASGDPNGLNYSVWSNNYDRDC